MRQYRQKWNQQVYIMQDYSTLREALDCLDNISKYNFHYPYDFDKAKDQIFDFYEGEMEEFRVKKQEAFSELLYSLGYEEQTERVNWKWKFLKVVPIEVEP